ncbi:tetratricopeptide repeat protein, partial [Streptomyces sp. NPDC059900]
MTKNRAWDRRSLLRSAAVLTGAAASATLPGYPAAARGGSRDADALFEAGEFQEAARAYERVLQKDPRNLHAARRRGFTGLLANQFPDAETYLTRALDLAPGDKETHRLLADCYLRQDKLALSAPHWRAAGEKAYGEWFAAIGGRPYQVHG